MKWRVLPSRGIDRVIWYRQIGNRHVLMEKGKPVKYPLKITNSIIRKRIADGTEWLLSGQQWRSIYQNESF